SYIQHVNTLYIIDNSDNKNNLIIKRLTQLSDKCVYIDNGGNQGIANALNVGAKLAIKNGAKWLLTMDQDSKFEKHDIENYLKCIINYKDIHNVAIFAPNRDIKQVKVIGNACSKIKKYAVITSGNIINLDMFTLVGGFDENLFIDEVDHDYCLRCNQLGEIIQFKNIQLIHQLGKEKLVDFFFFTIKITSHPPMRHYYAMRNLVYMIKKHRKNHKLWIIQRVFIVLKTLIMAMVFDKYKFHRFCYIYRGIKDYLLNNMGKISCL
ncbi:MAG: glycosyltransferase, partial [Spirochaetota bacterium]